jgi:hypothetical protein
MIIRINFNNIFIDRIKRVPDTYFKKMFQEIFLDEKVANLV